MKPAMKLTAAAAVALMAGTVSASAALIDFTSGLPGALSDPTGPGGGWVLTASPKDPWSEKNGPGSLGVLVGDNDGVGVKPIDEIDYDRGAYVTITFLKEVRIVSAYFLDLYIDEIDRSVKEIANISTGVGIGASDASLAATALLSATGKANKAGYGELLGLSLRGDTFSFWASDTNDGKGLPDFALAALDVAPVPLPAGALLFGTAIGGLGLMRRKRKS